MNIIEPLVIRLIGLNDFTDVMDTETMMTLLGTKEQPGFLLHKMMAYMGKQGYEMDTTADRRDVNTYRMQEQLQLWPLLYILVLRDFVCDFRMDFRFVCPPTPVPRAPSRVSVCVRPET